MTTTTLQHIVVVFAVTDTAHLYRCNCGITGPFRPAATDAEQDGRDHLTRTQQETQP